MPATAVLARVRLVALAVVLAIGPGPSSGWLGLEAGPARAAGIAASGTGEVGALGRLFLPAADGVRTLIEQVVGRIG